MSVQTNRRETLQSHQENVRYVEEAWYFVTANTEHSTAAPTTRGVDISLNFNGILFLCKMFSYLFKTNNNLLYVKKLFSFHSVYSLFIFNIV